MDRRFIHFFKILAKQNGYIKSEDLCAKLNIRPRTLREDIRQYKPMIEQEAGCQIDSKPNAGYFLQVFDEEKYNAFIKTLLQEESNNQFLIPISQEERINYIIRYFLANQNYVKLNNLADTIYVSRSTLNADIKEVKERLSYFHLKLNARAGHGLKIEGKEKDIRSCIAQYFYHFDNYDTRYIQGIDIHSAFIDQDAFNYIKDILYKTISKFEYRLTDFAFQNLAIHMLIAVNRMMGNSYVKEDIAVPDFFEDQVETKISLELAEKLNTYFGIKLPATEIDYIAIHLMGKQTMDTNNQQLVLDERTIKMTDKILKEIKSVYDIDFTADFDLCSMLSLHLQPMMNRLDYGLKISNPLNEQIKRDNPDAFEIAVLAGKVISFELNKEVGDNELGYLALHFALALERAKKPSQKNIIIVCASGAGSSQILLYKIKTKFKDYINHVLVTSAYQLPSIDQRQYDVILSTIPINVQTEIPIVQVQYFLDEDDVSSIEKILMDKNDASFIQHCFQKKYFYPHLQAKTREEAIQHMCQNVSKVHPLPEEFFQLVMERENVSATEIGNRVAVPHPIRLVMDETFVAVGILDKPIKWEKHHVKFIFMLCIKKQSDEALTVFNEVLTSLISNHERILEIEKDPTFETLKRQIEALSKTKAEELKDSIFQ